jgi:hypothetical protein
MRGPIKQDCHRVENDECCQIQGIVASTSEITIQFVVDAVSQIRLLEQRSFLRTGLAL